MLWFLARIFFHPDSPAPAALFEQNAKTGEYDKIAEFFDFPAIGAKPDAPAQPPVENPAPSTPPKAKADDKKPAEESKVVTKETYDKTASELAAIKKQLRERMTADELEAAKREDQRIELETLRRERDIAKLEATLAKGGVANSVEIAELFADGDIGKGIEALSAAKDKQIADLTKQLAAAQQRGAPMPPTGEPNSEFTGKTLAELMQMANKDPAMEARVLAHFAAQQKQ